MRLCGVRFSNTVTSPMSGVELSFCSMEDSMMPRLGCKGRMKVQGLQCRSLVHQLSSSILYFSDLFNFRVH